MAYALKLQLQVMHAHHAMQRPLATMCRGTPVQQHAAQANAIWQTKDNFRRSLSSHSAGNHLCNLWCPTKSKSAQMTAMRSHRRSALRGSMSLSTSSSASMPEAAAALKRTGKLAMASDGVLVAQRRHIGGVSAEVRDHDNKALFMTLCAPMSQKFTFTPCTE